LRRLDNSIYPTTIIWDTDNQYLWLILN
jgi:hypothetical protein